MTNLDSNINNIYKTSLQNPRFKAAQIESQVAEPLMQSEVQIPDIYYPQISNEKTSSTKDIIKKVDLMGLVYPWLEHPLLMAGTAAGLAVSVDKFSNACGGEYESSLVGKTASLGDRITNSNFVKSQPVQKVINGTRIVRNKVKKIFKNSDLISAIRNTPSSPEWAMVKDEMLSMQQRQVHEFNHLVSILKLTTDEPVSTTTLGIDKLEKEFIKKFFGEKKVNDTQVASAIQLKRLGWADDAIKNIIDADDLLNIVKLENIKKLGTTKDALIKLQNCKNITEAEIKAVEEMCLKAKGLRVGEGYYSFLGRFQPFARKIEFQELYNRLHSMRSGAKTKLGRKLSTFLQRCHRGFTFGGGKLGVLAFVSPILVATMIDTYKADKKEKLGTAAHGTVHAVSWVFTFPLALKIMHHLAGAQYAGMSKDKVEECRKLIREFNKEVDDNLLNDKALYDKKLGILKEKLKNLKAVKGQNLLTKVSKKIGSFLTMDLENIKSYRGGNFAMNTIRKIPSFLRNLGGVPMRFAIWIGISTGVLDALINKGIKTTFGDFYDRFKEEEHLNNKNKQKEFLKQDLQNRLLETQNLKNALNNEELLDENIKSNIKETPIAKENFVMQNPFEKDRKIQEEYSRKLDELEQIQPQKEKVGELVINPQSEGQESLPEKDFEQNNQIHTSSIDKKTTLQSVNDLNSQDARIDNYTYIPSVENKLAKEKEQDSYKYIPSQKPSEFVKEFNNSNLESALKRADRAEQQALNVLAGKFNTI